MKFRKNEEAVSPVIGVILMVAITLILAAVIAAFVFGMGTPKQAPQASIVISSTSASSGNITLTHSGGDSIDLSKTKAIIDGATSSQHNVINQLNITTKFFAAGDNLAINSSSDTVYLNNNGVTPGTNSTPFALTTGKVTVTLIDTDSNQQILKATATVTS